MITEWVITLTGFHIIIVAHFTGGEYSKTENISEGRYPFHIARALPDPLLPQGPPQLRGQNAAKFRLRKISNPHQDVRPHHREERAPHEDDLGPDGQGGSIGQECPSNAREY